MLNISYFISQIPENKRKVVKKIIYIERLGKRPYNPSTAVFYPPVSVLAFKLQIYGHQSMAVPSNGRCAALLVAPFPHSHRDFLKSSKSRFPRAMISVKISGKSQKLVSRRQTTIQVNFVDLCGSRVYVVCFISRPSNRVRKLHLLSKKIVTRLFLHGLTYIMTTAKCADEILKTA